MTTAFDDIGEKYDPIKELPFIRYGETYTVLKMLGNLQGKNVIDLACGTGFYSRRLKRLGAERVVGVDISEEMTNLARQRETEEPLGIEYIVSDATKLPETIGRFDLVLAVHLLHYASTEEQLKMMFQKIYKLLAPGGRLVAYTFNPKFTLTKESNTKYGVSATAIDTSAIPHCRPLKVTIHLDEPIVMTNYQWDATVYQASASEAGFQTLSWQPIELDPQGIETFGEEFWHIYFENCTICGLTCVK